MKQVRDFQGKGYNKLFGALHMPLNTKDNQQIEKMWHNRDIAKNRTPPLKLMAGPGEKLVHHVE